MAFSERRSHDAVASVNRVIVRFSSLLDRSGVSSSMKSR